MDETNTMMCRQFWLPRGLLLPLCLVLGATGASAGEIPSPALRELGTRYLDAGNEEGFWDAVDEMSIAGEYPLLEDGSSFSPDDYRSLTFLHRGSDPPPDNVILFANVNHVLPEELLFERISGTNVYYKTVEVPAGVRFEYRIHENDPMTGIFAGAKYGTRMHLLRGDPDPLNPNKTVYPDGLGEGIDYIETSVELPGASPQPYLGDQGSPTGELRVEERESELLGYSHKIFSYRPPDYDPARAYPLLILLDGGSYFTFGGFQHTLENLMARELIPPLLVLGLNAGIKDGQNQRNDEFTCNPDFRNFVAAELLPWFLSEHSVTADPKARVIAGSSFGGLFSAYFAFGHPEIVRNVLSQSGSFHWGRAEDPVPFEWLIREFAFGEKQPLRIYIEVGKLEGEYAWYNPNFPHQVVSHRHFKTILDMRGYDVEYVEYGGGHDMLSWRGGIADGLTHLFEGWASAPR